MILGGYPPFYQNTVNATFHQIRQASYKFHPDYWDGISPDAKNLIKSFLTIDPNARITAQDALNNHPWMTGRGEVLQKKSLKKNLEQFKKFNAERKENPKPVSTKNIAKSDFDNMYWLLTRS